MLPVAILAGGRATRLRPESERVPKSLLLVAGRPFIHWQLELLAAQGITRAVLCVGFLGEQIQAALGDGARFGISLRYSYDGDKPLGTGGALRRALSLLGPAFFVLYGDSYLPSPVAPIQAAYERSGQPALMTVFCNAGRWDRSNVWFEAGRILEYEKQAPQPYMKHIDYGLSVLSARALNGFGAGDAFDLGDLWRELARRGELAGLEVGTRFYEIGSHAGIAATQRYLRARTPS
jgi:NDP-sugar pyrophosphorylase family protein